jgi:hypothetical protein
LSARVRFETRRKFVAGGPEGPGGISDLEALKNQIIEQSRLSAMAAAAAGISALFGVAAASIPD